MRLDQLVVPWNMYIYDGYTSLNRTSQHIVSITKLWFSRFIMIDFTLSPSLVEAQQNARAFALNILKKEAAAKYSSCLDQKSRFQATRPFYKEAVRQGLVKAQIPVQLGGTMESLTQPAIVLEELFTVEPTVSITIVASALGLMPLILDGTPALQERYLKPFLSDNGDPLASLMHSEPTGTANWLEKGGPGLQTTATKVGNEYVINGEKVSRLKRSTRYILITFLSFGLPIAPAGTKEAQIWHVSCAESLMNPPSLKIPRSTQLHSSLSFWLRLILSQRITKTHTRFSGNPSLRAISAHPARTLASQASTSLRKTSLVRRERLPRSSKPLLACQPP